MDPNQPAQPPAQPGTPPATPPANPPEPVTPPADGNPAPTVNLFDSLGEEDKKYLQSQGVTEMNEDSFKKLLNHNISLRKTAASNGNTPPTPPADPSTPPVVTPGEPSTTPTAPEQPTAPAVAKGLDPVTALNLATSLGIQFPELKDGLSSGTFYSDMNALGIPTTDANGAVNLNGIIAYGKLAQERAQTAAKIAEYEKPNPNNIPDANPTTPKVIDANTPMSKQLARAIVTNDKGNARFSEAQQYLETEANK